MKFLIILLFPLFIYAQQQNNPIQHKVVKGETVFQIAKKYQVTPFDIYRLNPDAKDGVQENATLLIPKFDSKSTGIVHKVAPKKHFLVLLKYMMFQLQI